jgi:hypothetical protein
MYSTVDRRYLALSALPALDDCLARVPAHITRDVGNVAVFTARCGADDGLTCSAGVPAAP